jgi:hypothetical protein
VSAVSPEELAALAEELPGVKRKGRPGRPGWYVDDRLVARLDDPVTAVVRVPLEEREALLAAYAEGFGVPPRMESHHKVEAYLDHVSLDGLREALRLAWDFQRR